MTAPLTQPELLQLRMRAQLLSRSREAPTLGQSGGSARIAEVARHMLAMQGQDWLSSRWALGVRAPGTRVADVYAAFDAGLIVRSWPMRGTLHVVAAEDIGWIQALTAERVLRGAAKRREMLGLDDATLDHAVAVSLEALSDGARLTREELAAAWTAAGIAWRSNWRYHIVWWLCQNGLAVFGPVTRGVESPDALPGEPLIVSAEGWLPPPRSLAGDEALCELATRYAAARGPVTAKDLAWWSGLTSGASKRGLTLAEATGTLARVEVDGSPLPHWLAAEALGQPVAPSPSSSGGATWMLLPAFDEHLLGYADRSPQLDAAHFERIVPGRNGVFRATITEDGVTRGTWRRARAHGAEVVASPFPGVPFSREGVTAALDPWAEFFELGEASLAPEAAPSTSR